MARRTPAALTALVLVLGLPATASAGGFEFASPGTRALGRGGAFIARADDPMALGFNPAALAFLPNYQLMLGSHLSFLDSCVQRSGGYDDSGVSDSFSGFPASRYGDPDPSDPDNWVNQPYPEVCREGFPSPSPQLVFSGHPIPELGFAIGILAPAGVANAQWGNPDGSVDVNGRSLPTPTRYALVDQNLLLFHPSVGVGVAPVEWLAFGVTLQWGVAIVDFTNYTSAGTGPEDPANDVRTELSVTDPFVPAMIASVHVVPIDQLDIALTARFSDSIDADGDLRVTTGINGTSESGSLSPRETVLPGTTLHAGQPWQFGLGIRYADRTTTRYRDPEEAGRVTGRVEDRMQNETFDLELNVVYTMNSQVTDFVVSTPDGSAAAICEADGAGGCLSEFSAPLPGSLPIPHGWQDQVTVSVGSDWNIVPGMVAARAGAHFETNGLNNVYATNDVLLGMRLGLHLGATFRFDRFDLSIAYAHIFQFNHTVSDGNYRLVAATGSEGQCADGAAYDPAQPVPSRGCYPQGAGAVVNNGTYTGEYNVLSVQGSYHFD